MLDLLIRGGIVVTPEATGVLDLGIKGEQIVQIGPLGSVTDDVARVVDASGRLVVPGGIDPHIHAHWPLPDPDGTPHALSAGPEHVSKVALYGGTTTYLDFAAWSDASGAGLAEAIEKRQAEWSGNSHCDYSFHVMLQGAVSSRALQELPEVIQQGFPSIKIFTTDVTPSRRGRKLHFGDIWEVLKVLGRHGGIAAVHAEDDEIVMHMYDKLEREGRTGFENMSEVHNTLAEDLAFRRVIRLAQHTDGAALYMMHVSSAPGVEAIAEARAAGYAVYGETLHHYALFTSEAYLRPRGQIYHTYPSLKTRADTRALWRGMADRSIQAIGTDGICTPLEVKLRGRRVDDTTGGNAGVEPRMGIMYTEVVERRGRPLSEFVALTSTNAARIMGLYPQKGVLQVGADADIAIMEVGLRRNLQKEDLHETDYSPWEDWAVGGWPVMTISRGRVAVEGGELLVDSNHGRLVKRKVADSVISGPT